MTRQGVVLAGYFGFGNAGDELIERVLRKSVPAPCTTLSNKPSVSDDATADRWDLLRLSGLFKRSKALVCGGGELFQTRTSVKSFLYYAGLPALARARGARFVAYGQGLDPDLPAWARKAAALSLGLADRIWVRDETSAALLRSAGCRTTVSVAPDPVWALDLPSAKPAVSTGRLLWILRDPADPQRLSRVARAVGEKIGFSPTFLFLHPDRDRFFLKGLSPVEPWETAENIARVMGEHDAVVSMRYHGLVLAALAGRPAVALSAHGKVRGLARQLGCPVVDPGAEASPFMEALTLAVRSRAETAARVRPIIEGARRGLAELSGFLNAL
jgi:polysaccharide pyruvyl transferase CsaB